MRRGEGEREGRKKRVGRRATKAKERVLRMWGGGRSGRKKSYGDDQGRIGQLGRRHGTNERRNRIKDKTWWDWQTDTASS